jgi:hypothetical protein
MPGTANCQVATAAYCLAIAHLINHPRDAQGAITAVRAWLLQYQQQAQQQQQQQAQQQQQQQQGRTLRSDAAKGPAAAVATVLEWLEEAQAEGPGPEVQTNMGFMRWGFVHAFRWAVCFLVQSVCRALWFSGRTLFGWPVGRPLHQKRQAAEDQTL